MSLSRNEERQNEFLAVLLKELRDLAAQVKKLETELKATRKQLVELLLTPKS